MHFEGHGDGGVVIRLRCFLEVVRMLRRRMNLPGMANELWSVIRSGNVGAVL